MATGRQQTFRRLGREVGDAPLALRAYLLSSLLSGPAGIMLTLVGGIGHHHLLLIIGVVLLGLSILDSAVVFPLLRVRRRDRGTSR